MESPSFVEELEWQKDWLRQRDHIISRNVPEWLQVELSQPYKENVHATTNIDATTLDRTALLETILTQLSQAANLRAPDVSPTVPARTIDYLLRLLVHPYTTSPDHPALRKCVAMDKTSSSFQVYMRSRKSTIGQELTNLRVGLRSQTERTKTRRGTNKVPSSM